MPTPASGLGWPARGFNQRAVVPAILPVLATCGVSLLMVWRRPVMVPPAVAMAAVLLNIVVLIATAPWQGRLHSQLAQAGKSASAINRLVATNWIRTAAFSSQAIFAIWIIDRLTEAADEPWVETCVGLTGWTISLDIAAANFAAGIAGAFSELEPTELDVVEKDGFLVIRGKNTAVHTGPFLGIAPTHNRVTWEFVDMYRVGADGRLNWHLFVTDWNYVRLQPLGTAPDLPLFRHDVPCSLLFCGCLACPTRRRAISTDIFTFPREFSSLRWQEAAIGQ
jgi:hypothetical protein